jgi:uncharacterized protein (DUF362 family)
LEKLTRRFFIYLSSCLVAFVTLFSFKQLLGSSKAWAGINKKKKSQVFLVKNGTPEQNVRKIIEMMGGISKFIDKNDVVILKPNCQWWNQGRTNLAAMKSFIDLVLQIPGFTGEVIIAENQHFMDDSLPDPEKDNIRGWIKLGEINGKIDGVNHTMNSLVELFHEQGHKNVTKVHWRDGGPKHDDWGNGQNGGIVSSPADGDGYIWSDIDYIYSPLFGLKKWFVKLTYPVFTSTYSGFTIDFKDGVFERDGKGGGRYLKNTSMKFINFAALNDHGRDTGITGTIKNYMGVTDLSCGDWGKEPEGYHNVHACGGRYFRHAKAGPLGYFMKHIKRADLNIITAEWVGWGDRTNVSKATRCRTILAGADPVALDYYGAKHLILPLSKNKKHHDPDAFRSPIRSFLSLTAETFGEGSFSDEEIVVSQHDLSV